MSAILYIFMLLLAGCSTLKPGLPIAGPVKTAQGVFAVIAPEVTQSGHFTWIQTGSDFSLELYGPLGLGATTLIRQGDQVCLKTAQGKTYQASSPEAVLETVLGWSMPVSGFIQWLWAEPDPAAPFTATYDARGRILNLQQQGWSITYIWVSSDTQQPVRITLVNKGDIKVKIAIDGF